MGEAAVQGFALASDLDTMESWAIAARESHGIRARAPLCSYSLLTGARSHAVSLSAVALGLPSSFFARAFEAPLFRLRLSRYARTPPGDYVLTVADKSFRGPPAAGAGDAETAGTLLTNLPAVSLPLTVLPPVG